MESCKSIIEATATKWRWIRNCWRLRLPVREALLAPKADTTESVLAKAELEFWKTKASESDKALKEAKDANKALVHFIHTRNTPDVDLRAVKKAMATVALAFLPLLAMSQPLEPYRHNFFTTNPAPVVDVLPGTNVSVQFSLTGTSQRHYTVNTDTNLIPIYAGSVTNGYPWTNIFPQGVAGGQTNQVLTQTGWSGYPQVTNLSLKTNSLGTAIVPSLWLTNPTPASLGAQQNSPAMMLAGQGWKSGDSTTHPVAMGFVTTPIQGSSSDPIGSMIVAKSISGAAPTATGIYFYTTGTLAANGIQMDAAGAFYWTARAFVQSPADGQLKFLNSNFTSFDKVFFGPQTSDWLALKVETTNSPTLSIRTGNDGNYASLVVSNVTSKSDALAATITPSLWLTNATAAALGAQQNSPALMLGGQGWRSGNSTTHSTAMGLYTLPVQGSAANPTMRMRVATAIDGGAPTFTGTEFADNGGFTSGATILSGASVIAATASQIGWSLRSGMFNPSDGTIKLLDSTGNSFSSLVLGPQTSDWLALKVETTNSPTLSIRTGNDGNYASLVTSNITSRSDALAATITPSLWLTNATAAALGAQQNSPALMLGGHGWRSGNSTTHSTAMGMYTLPIQQSVSDPIGILTFVSSIDGVAPTATGITARSDGRFGAGGFDIGSKLALRSTVNGNLNLTDGTTLNTFTAIGLGPATSDWLALKVETTNSPTLSIRTGNDGNYASLVVSNATSKSDALGASIIPSVWLTNSTAAALGAQQNSPALMLGGQGWRTSTSGSTNVGMGFFIVPVQGTSADPTAQLRLFKSIGGAGNLTTGNGTYFDSEGRVFTGYTLTVGGNITALANLSYDIGAPTAQFKNLYTSNITASGSVTATNNYIHQLYPTNGFTYCNSTNEVYMVNAATNPIFVLPDATTVKGKSFLFTTTNNGTFFTVTNWTGTQTIADGSSLSYTNQDNGKKVVSFISDGAHWWLASKGRVTLPSASWSCSTNTTFPNVTNMVTLDTQEANNGVGITLDNSAWTTVGVGSRIWVTNAGMYMLTFSAMWSKTGGGSANGDIWIRQDGTIIPRTMTLQTIQNSTSTNVMTVNFILPVTKTTYFDLVGASPDGTAQLQAMPAITSPFQRPAAPSIIVTINKCSD